jgi:tRNA(fMet)-specific endonuclease VapC
VTACIDTDVLVDVLRGHGPAVAWFATLQGGALVPGFVAMELHAGCRNAPESRAVRALLSPLEIVWPSPAAMDAALNGFPESALRDGIGVLDALIAQTTIEQGATLFTFNARHYGGISSLDVKSPYSR